MFYSALSVVASGAPAPSFSFGASAGGACCSCGSSEDVQRVCSILDNFHTLARPSTYQVVSEQLHDESRILITFLTESVKLSNRIIESLFGEMARPVGRVEDFVVEDGEVQSETEADRMCGSQVRCCDLGSFFVCLQRFICGRFPLLFDRKLCQVSVVVALPVHKVSQCKRTVGVFLHLVVEDFGFTRLRRRDQVLVQDFEDIFTDLSKLFLNLLSVVLDEFDLSVIAL